MKYEYGVEYETNGVKPDLPDNVLVEVHLKRSSITGWYGEKDCISSKVGAWDWLDIDKFRIVDERYEAKVDYSSWYERGYHPEVGCKVDYEGTTVEVIARDQKLPQVCVRHGNGELSVLAVAWLKPIPTERDKLVNECVKILGDGALSGKVKSLRDQAELLVTRGWRSTEVQDETEFGYSAAKSCRNIAVSDAIELYRAGCRFIEQGE